MNLHLIRKARTIASLAAAVLCLYSCVEIDNTIGTNYIPKDQRFTTYSVDIPITDLRLDLLDSLSGVSSTRITVGAVRDDEFGLTTRASAFSLVPFYDTLDYGDPGTQKINRFRLRASLDTVSVSDPGQQFILQNLNVYELTKSVSKQTDINSKVEYNSSKRITKGIPVLNGVTDMIIDFSDEFAQKYMNIKQEDLTDIDTYLSKYPGIYIETDNPQGNGGRINMYDLQLQFDESYLSSCFAELNFTANYKGVEKDTAFLFYFGAADFYDVDSLLTNSSVGYLPETCLNVTTQSEISKAKVGQVGESFDIEGGGGLKPMIPASFIRQAMIDAISPYGDPKEAIINKASVVLPFEDPGNYDNIDQYPSILSPAVKIRYTADSLQFYILTDYSDTNQDQGDRNMSLFQYAPDFTYHAQSLLRLKDLDKISNYDLWFLIQYNETYIAQQQKMDSETRDLYNQMLYSSYYNDMYNGYGYGGYGGYGYGYGGYGYGGYGNYYNNYYYYYMMSQMMNDQSSTVSYTTAVMIDKDRFYKGRLLGPGNSTGRVPTLKLIFSVPE